jgi:hypothetical protein
MAYVSQTRVSSGPRAVGLPAWVANAPNPGNFYELPGTALSSVPPAITPAGSPDAKVTAWGTLVCDPVNSVIYGAANGGHTDYAGNEVDGIALNVANPAWVELRAPTPAASVTTAADRYLDGRPASAHGYYTVQFDSEGGSSRIIRVGGGSRWFDAGVIQATDAFGIASNDWSTLTSISGLLAGFENPAVCRDTRNGNIFMAGSPSQWVMAKWEKSTNTWSDVRSAATTELSFAAARTASAWDSTRNRIFFIGGTNAVKHVYTPDTNADAAITLSGASAAPVAALFDAGMVYIPSLDVFLARDVGAGGTIYQITPSGVCTTFATTGGGSIAAASTNAIYGRFQYVPNLKGCVYWPTYTSNCWYLRVEA